MLTRSTPRDRSTWQPRDRKLRRVLSHWALVLARCAAVADLDAAAARLVVASVPARIAFTWATVAHETVSIGTGNSAPKPMQTAELWA